MFKRKTKQKVFLLFIFLHIFIASNTVFAKDYPNINDLGLTSKSAVLMEADTGAIIYEQNSHEKLPPASVTKVMTLLLIYDSVSDGKIKWDDMVTVSEHAASMGGSQVFLEPMEQQSVKELTKCIAIASANDGAVAMAEFIGGSEEGFVELMNQKAKELGMKDTHFVNACGLDADGHLTSANDIALMSRELITKHPDIFEYTKTWQDSIIHKTRRGETEFGLTNTNKLLKLYDSATGLKTGSTGKALYCLSGTAEKNGLSLIGVVMAAPDPKIRFQEVIKLFDYGFANYSIMKGLPIGEKTGEVTIYKGAKDTVETIINEEVSFLSPKGESQQVETEYKMIPSLNAPFEKGTKAGEVIYKIQGEEVGRADIVTKEGIDKINIGTMIEKLLEKWCR